MHTTSQAPIDETGLPSRPAATAQVAGQSRVAADGSAVAGIRSTIGAYIALTKPRIIELLLVTTLPTMILAQGGFPDFWLVVKTLVGGTLAAASANVFNCYIDRDIDELMNRTKRRPLVTGEISPRAALVFATALGVIALLWFALLVNAPSAWLTFAAIAIYVVGYTMILKRRTPQNIVWGGIAGCMPVFIGWSAVTGSLSWSAVALFLVIFFWTPPHYWPLSIKFKKDYANAGVPMLPVVADNRKVAREMIGYTVAMIASSLALWWLAPMTWVYGVVAIGLGAWFLALCVMMLRRANDPTKGKLGAMKVFHASITYLTLLFVAVAVDVFLPF
ncbi:MULTISPECIES: heme o synthase [Oerskovia]|uniref:Protoheme IX farnesyltransferase n=1 Tax=Oerskovia paurometabola TaxID=162170 RepID=A0ABW1XE45_9CELL|nr:MULTISPECIES: heme o synthase [Oerskovia]MBM7497327.1 protoheme IX farnesyltransferase [Oerskovia paurometabola]